MGGKPSQMFDHTTGHSCSEDQSILLSQGIVLTACTAITEYYVLIPCHENYTPNMHTLALDLKEFGMEMMLDEECESVVTDHAIKVWCAEIYVKDDPVDNHCVREATHAESVYA